MTGDAPDPGHYLRVFQASARLFWRSSHPWQEALAGRSEECRDAWTHLAQVLAEASAVPTGPDAPSDPTRHLITRRGSDDRPVTLSDAAHDWLTRVQEQPGAPHPRDIIAEHPEMHGQKTLTTNFVLVTNDWCAMAVKMVGELQHRPAPGRPACTVGSDARGLSDAPIFISPDRSIQAFRTAHERNSSSLVSSSRISDGYSSTIRSLTPSSIHRPVFKISA